MSRKLFERYRQEHYADAPDGQPHNDPNVPYEHLQKYAGKQISYSYADMHLGMAFHGSGVFSVGTDTISVRGDRNSFTLVREAVGKISWDQGANAYLMANGRLSLRPG